MDTDIHSIIHNKQRVDETKVPVDTIDERIYHLLMNGSTKCAMCVPWNTVQPLKRKEILTPATTWMNLENIRLRETRDKKTNTV